MLLLLVRHGQTEWTEQRRLQGSSADEPLSAAGCEQVRRLRDDLEAFGVDAAVSSPLRRARQTAAELGHPSAALDERWAEADLGDWSGATVEMLQEEAADDYAAWRDGRLTPPGGEPFESMAERVGAAAETARRNGGHVLVTTHGGPIRAACHALLGLAPHQLTPVAPASLTAISLDTQPRLVVFNRTPEIRRRG